MHSTASFARGKGQPDRDIYNLLATLNQEQLREKHDINGLYEGRLRSHAQRFEDLKRKWEGFTGVPVPKKLRTSEPIHNEQLVVAKANEVPLVQNIQTSVIEEEEEQQIMIPTTDPMVTTEITEQTTSSEAPTPPTMPPHPDDKINIDNMTVNDLRKELKKRQLATGGRKVELQERLREYLAEATAQREMEWASKFAIEVAAEDKSVPKKQVQISDSNGGDCNEDMNAMDVVIEDEEVANDSENIKSAAVVNKQEVNPVPVVKMETVTDQVAQSSNSHSAVVAKKQAPKSALKPSKYPSSIIESTTLLDYTMPAPEPVVPRTFVREPSPAGPKQLIPNKVSNSSTESSTNTSTVPSSTFKKSVLQSSASKSTAPASFLHKSPGPSAYRSGGGAESTKLLQKKQAISEAAEARKARIAEMRQKSKPAVVGSTSTTEPPPSNSKYAVPSSMKKMAPMSVSKPNTVVAKMREKVAAEKNSERADPALPTRPSQPVETIRSMSSSSTKATTLVPQIPTASSSQYASKPHPSALTSINDPANKPMSSPKRVLPEKQLSPIQTYVMSDREESDSEDESDEEEDDRHKPKKSIPLWAQKTNLHRALERQFADGPNRLDPDKIFGEVLTCNLEEIFDKKKSRYQRRTSSGNWTKDHVTAAEKLTYKRTMGYDKR